MPGNDTGDWIHNFFGQDNSEQGQPLSQVADRNWSALTINHRAGSERQIASPLFSNVKSPNVQQTAELESGHGGQPSSTQHGMNFSPTNLRADFSRNHSQGQQPIVNGYMHGHQFFQTRQNEANFLGVGAESDRQNLSSHCLSVNSGFDSQKGNGPELHRKNSVSMDLTESPVNYDFFGNQQMSGQNVGMMQTLQRQQSGVADMQMLQQQLMMNQIQEMQRHQQYQKQQEASQLNGMSQASAFSKQAAGNQSMAMINGIPVHDASNVAWQSELMAANANWPQRGTASFVPGSSGGLMLSPDQGQVHLMGMTPQQLDQSSRRVPVSGSRVSSSQFSPIQVDKPKTLQISGASTSVQGNQYTGFSDQISMHDSRQGYEGKDMIGTSINGQGINSGFDLENMHPVNPQPSKLLGQEYNSRLDTVFPFDKSQDKPMMQGAPSQSVATLDPTEEKILFGSDDNLWDAFGKGNIMGSMGCSVSDGSDIGAFSSLQSGSWSALMQSAVAETSGGNVGSQEEWSGLTFQNNGYSEPNQQTQTTGFSGKNQPTWVNNSLQNPTPDTAVSHNNVPVSKQSEVTVLCKQNERLQDESSQRFPHCPGEAAKRLDSGLPQKFVAESSHIFRKPYGSSDAWSNSKWISSHSTNQPSTPSYNAGGQPRTRPNGFNFLDAVSTGMNAVQNQQNEQSLQLQGSQSINQKAPAFETAGSGPDVWKSDNLSNSVVNLEGEIASAEFKAVDSNVNAVSASLSSNITRANQVRSQQIPNSNNIDIWKHVDSSRISQGNDVTSNLQYVNDKHEQNTDLSGDSTSANGKIGTHETQNFKTKRSTIDGFYNMPQNAAAVAVKENNWLDTTDLQTIPGGKPKSSGNFVRKPPARKFQYHPMGDVDVEPPYALKSVTHSQSTLHHISQGSKVHEQGYAFPYQNDRSSMGSEKDPFSGFQEPKGLRGSSSTSVLPGSAASTSTSIENAVNNQTSNMITPSSRLNLALPVASSMEFENPNRTPNSSLKPERQSPLPSSVTRLWRIAAQRNMRNQWSKLASLRTQWLSASSSGRSHATSLINSYLSHKYMPSMELGVLKDMPCIREKASAKFLKQQKLYQSKLLSAYKEMVSVVINMVNTGRSMRCYIKGTSGSPLIQFCSNPEDSFDKGDGDGIPVFTVLSVYSIENLATELVQFFTSELILKRLLVVELLAATSEEPPDSLADSWSEELYLGECDDLVGCNLYSKETGEIIHPQFIESKSDMNAVKSTTQPEREVLQVYLTTWLAEAKIHTRRVNDILATMGMEMQFSLS